MVTLKTALLIGIPIVIVIIVIIILIAYYATKDSLTNKSPSVFDVVKRRVVRITRK
jgi:di/tricarboxylate transporter